MELITEMNKYNVSDYLDIRIVFVSDADTILSYLPLTQMQRWHSVTLGVWYRVRYSEKAFT